MKSPAHRELAALEHGRLTYWDEQGRAVYFPYGSMGRGYVVDGLKFFAQMKTRRRWLDFATVLGFCLAIVMARVESWSIADTSLCALLAGLCGLGARELATARPIRRAMRVSEMRLTLTLRLRAKAQNLYLPKLRKDRQAAMFWLLTTCAVFVLPFAPMYLAGLRGVWIMQLCLSGWRWMEGEYLARAAGPFAQGGRPFPFAPIGLVGVQLLIVIAGVAASAWAVGGPVWQSLSLLPTLIFFYFFYL